MKVSNRNKTIIRHFKIIAFGFVLAVFFAIGCISALRPTTSVVEKRELTKRPSFKWTTFWNGDYTKDISTWYADTFPFRESMISTNQKIQKLYGTKGEQLVSGGEGYAVADEIPEIDETEQARQRELIGAPTIGIRPNPFEALINAKAEEREFENLPDGTITDKGEKLSSIYVTQDAGYEMFYFNQPGADAFANTINRIQSKVGNMVNIYVLIVPTSAGVMLDDSVIKDMGASDQAKTLDYLYSKINHKVHTVNPLPELRGHNAEYVYFRTDHHWTQLGAYYGYRAFCKEKGITPIELSEYEKVSYPGFKGTFCQLVPSLGNKPDTVEGFIPIGTNNMKMVNDNDGGTYDWYLVNDVSGYAETELYACYAGGDNSFSSAHNPNLYDGSSVMVIKDSFGNALIPWLVDQYQDVYWMDVRYTSNTISQMVRDCNVQDVIICMSIFSGTTEGKLGQLTQVGQ